MWGDARTASGANNSVVYFIPPPPQLATAAAATWSIRSQSRKIVDVREVTVWSLDASSLHEAPRRTVRRGVPAVVFALGGLTSNYRHTFSDVLGPLFTTARAFGGDIELLATGAGALAASSAASFASSRGTTWWTSTRTATSCGATPTSSSASAATTATTTSTQRAPRMGTTCSRSASSSEPPTPCRRQEPASRYRASLVVAERGRGSCSSSGDARGGS